MFVWKHWGSRNTFGRRICHHFEQPRNCKIQHFICKGKQIFNEISKSFAILFPGAFLGSLACFIPIRFTNREMFQKRPIKKIEKIRLMEQISIWKKSLNEYTQGTEDEEKVKTLLQSYIVNLEAEANAMPDVEANLDELDKQYRIHDVPLFIKSSIVLSIVLFLFFVESYLEPYIHLSLPWISLMGAVTLLIFSGIHEVEEFLEKSIEWPTMVNSFSL
jgi:hypothetical protein